MSDSIRTIIVDDEPRIRRGVERLVLSCGDEWDVVGTFQSGKECLEQVQKSNLQFELIITDIKMPEMDGLTLIKKLKKFTSFYSIVVSGFDDFEFLQTAIREGASDYLIKPIDREEFKQQLDRLKKEIFRKRQQEARQRKMEQRAAQLQYVLQIQKLAEATRQDDVDLSYLEWTKEFPKGNYKLLYVSIDHIVSKSKHYEKEEWNTWKFAVENILDESVHNYRFNENIHIWKWRGEEELSFWILIHNGESERIEAFTLAEEIKNNVKEFTPFTCSIAVGNDFEDLTLLSNEKNELITYKQFRILYGGNRIFSKKFIDRIQENRKLNKGNRRQEIENSLNRIQLYLESKHAGKTLAEIDQLLNKLQEIQQPDEIEHITKLLGISLINYIMKSGRIANESERIQHLFNITNKSSNFSEYRNEVHDWCKEILKQFDELLSNERTEPVEFAKRWIKEHIGEKITIPKISGQVYMNPTYFCEYFKKNTGETVLDYVTRVRLEKARELLVKSNMKITDVATQVGYSDTKYFSKLFKNTFGETPSKYKEKSIFK